MKTYIARPSDIVRKWYLVDATDIVLGRLAVILANYVRGKHKSYFTPSIDCGDNVVACILIFCALVGGSSNSWSSCGIKLSGVK